MDNVPVDSSPRSAIARRLLIQSSASGEIKLPAVPGMLDEYVTVCRMLFGSFGIQFTDDELTHLRGVLTEQLAQAYQASSRSQIVITYNKPACQAVDYTIAPRCLTVEEAYAHARLTGLHLLATIQAEIGDLDRVVRIVKVLGMVNAVPGFTQQPEVINGCSDLLVEVLGDRGRHARSAVGVASLPRNITVEIEAIVEVA